MTGHRDNTADRYKNGLNELRYTRIARTLEIIKDALLTLYRCIGEVSLSESEVKRILHALISKNNLEFFLLDPNRFSWERRYMFPDSGKMLTHFHDIEFIDRYKKFFKNYLPLNVPN